MVSSVSLYLAFLGLLCCERGVELLVSRRNARLALASGGIETGRGLYAVMVVVHALFPISCAAEVLAARRPFPGAIGVAALVFTSANAALLLARIPAEERALGETYGRAFERLPRLLPRVPRG